MNQRVTLVAILFAAMVNPCPAGEKKSADGKRIAPRVATIQSPNLTIKAAIEALAKQTGMEVDISEIDGNKSIRAAFDKAEFWKILDEIALQTGYRVAIGQNDKSVRLIAPNPAGVKPIVSVDGPFRISAREIEARRDLLSGSVSYELTLEIAWEPRLPVIRIDATPVIIQGKDDVGKPIKVKPIASREPVYGLATLTKVRLEGLSRDSKQIDVLKGSFRITAAEELLRYQFDDLVKLPAAKQQNGVGVSVSRFAKAGTAWIADIDLNYPPDGPFFESFEIYRLSRNQIALISPDGKKITTDDDEKNGNSIRYRFTETADFKPANLNGWKLHYETPGAMREVTVQFELRGIPLP